MIVLYDAKGGGGGGGRGVSVIMTLIFFTDSLDVPPKSLTIIEVKKGVKSKRPSPPPGSSPAIATWSILWEFQKWPECSISGVLMRGS